MSLEKCSLFCDIFIFKLTSNFKCNTTYVQPYLCKFFYLNFLFFKVVGITRKRFYNLEKWIDLESDWKNPLFYPELMFCVSNGSQICDLSLNFMISNKSSKFQNRLLWFRQVFNKFLYPTHIKSTKSSSRIRRNITYFCLSPAFAKKHFFHDFHKLKINKKKLDKPSGQ